MATWRPSLVSSARYTTPMPPSPSLAVMRKWESDEPTMSSLLSGRKPAPAYCQSASDRFGCDSTWLIGQRHLGRPTQKGGSYLPLLFVKSTRRGGVERVSLQYRLGIRDR